MKALRVLAFVSCSLLLLAQTSAAPKAFKGEIADTSCAYNVHSLDRSHQEMLKTKSAGNDAASCSRYCVQHLGADYVLVQKEKIYRLVDQPNSVIEPLAGKTVTVHGTLDPKTSTIHVSGIVP